MFDVILSRLEKWSRTRQISKTAKVSLDESPQEIDTLKNLFLMKRECPQIRVEHVSFGYDRNTIILEEIDLSVGPNEIAVISGDSGTGKSTLLNIIASLVQPMSGSVAGAENLGFIFQDDRFLPWRNNVWNVALPLIYQGYDRRSARSFARYMLQEVGLEGVETAYPEELSGGMKKRLAFARCFARLPGSILMDEPFTGLHKEARKTLWEKFFALLHLHPVPVVIVTHFPEEIAVTEQCRFYTLSGHPARLGTGD
jgi:ABC-type nitrate/sulfonate/bicarbonate transport system ATPase subunit